MRHSHACFASREGAQGAEDAVRECVHLDGSNGFAIAGPAADAALGTAVSGAGDVNLGRTAVVLHPLEIVSVAAELLGKPVASLAAQGDRIVDALEELLTRARG